SNMSLWLIKLEGHLYVNKQEIPYAVPESYQSWTRKGRCRKSCYPHLRSLFLHTPGPPSAAFPPGLPNFFRDHRPPENPPANRRNIPPFRWHWLWQKLLARARHWPSPELCRILTMERLLRAFRRYCPLSTPRPGRVRDS